MLEHKINLKTERHESTGHQLPSIGLISHYLAVNDEK